MVFPLAKLGTLALKTFCKPIAKRLKKEAGINPKFRLFIVNVAQANHRLKTQMQRSIYGHRMDVAIRPLNEEKAVQAAADLLGEFFVFMVVGVALVFEFQRSAKKEERKEEMRRNELKTMKQRDEALSRELEILRHRLDELERHSKGRGGFGAIFSPPRDETSNGSEAAALEEVYAKSNAKRDDKLAPPFLCIGGSYHYIR